ncbi:MAG: ferredoxin reductase [Chloroflexota bacterium]|nr:ferredoxin reductase [Chloroflexota bacterium]
MTGPLEWQVAAVKKVTPETPRVKSFTFELPRWTKHRAGQHYDIRLTAADGYVAQRSYSIASAPEREGELDLTVELVEGGEVSTFLHEQIVPGDRIELRGPIGGYFVWDAARTDGPLLMVAGGSGVVPMMSMLRHRAAAGASVPAPLLFSSRSYEEIIYREELDRLAGGRDGFELFHTLTRSRPDGWAGFTRRIDRRMLGDVSRAFGSKALTFICGPTPLVESAANALLELGLRAERIRTERFGPSGT